MHCTPAVNHYLAVNHSHTSSLFVRNRMQLASLYHRLAQTQCLYQQVFTHVCVNQYTVDLCIADQSHDCRVTLSDTIDHPNDFPRHQQAHNDTPRPTSRCHAVTLSSDVPRWLPRDDGEDLLALKCLVYEEGGREGLVLLLVGLHQGLGSLVRLLERDRRK